MPIPRKALQFFSVLGLTASTLLSPAAADATTSVGEFRRSEELPPRILLANLSQASAFLLGKPGTNSALQFNTEDCESTELTMAPLDLTSSYQMWKYDSSTFSIQSIACPDRVITISDSSCESVKLSVLDSTSDNLQDFRFTIVANLSDDETTGVTISSSAANCSNKFLSDGGSANGSIGNTIKMRENDENDKWIVINLSTGNNYFHFLRKYISEDADPTYAASISMSSNGNRIAISGSKPEGNNTFTGFVEIFDADNSEDSVGIVTTDSIVEAAAPILNVVLSGDGETLAVGAVFPTDETLVSGVQVYDLTDIVAKPPDKIGGLIEAGVMGDLPGLRLDMSDDGSKLVVGGRNYDSGRGRARLYNISKTGKTVVPSGDGFEGGVGSEDHLGSSVSLTGNGVYVAIGGTGVMNSNNASSGAVKVYRTNNSEQVGDVINGTDANDATGFSVDLVELESSLYVAVASIFFDGTDGSSDRGKVEIFTLKENKWTKVGQSLVGDRGATLDFSNGKYHIGDSFGFSLGLAKMSGATGGLRVAVGSPFFSNVRESDAYYGVVKLFEYNTGGDEWEQLAYDLVGNSKTSASGTSIALVNGGDTLAIGGGPDGASSNGKVVVYAQEETSSQPSHMPSDMPSKEPSKEPSHMPSVVPSKEPSLEPSSVPSSPPSSIPSKEPSSDPSFQPSSIPSEEPSSVPSSPPSSLPSKEPSSAPSSVPTTVPSSQPSSVPSKKPSSVPSSVPSSPPSSLPSENPSGIPSNVPSSQPSFSPSQHPSDIPSVRPSVSLEPSSQPSLVGERKFMILSKFKKFTDLPMGDRPDKNWCLERLFAPGNTEGNPLKMRPCDSGDEKQIWYYHNQAQVITSQPNDVSGGVPSELCIIKEGKKLVAQSCTGLPVGVDTIVSKGALNHDNLETTGSISMKTSTNEFYFAIDSLRIFSRVKLLKKGTENSSYDKWQFRYHGPSSFPTSLPSRKPSEGPSAVSSSSPSEVPSITPSKRPSNVPSTVPSENPSLSPSKEPSAVPSTVPSITPSSQPSWIPSNLPPQFEYEFLPINSAAQCPAGLEVPQDECKGAIESLWADNEKFFTAQNGQVYTNYHGGSGVQLAVDDWDFAPCGCFLWLNDGSKKVFTDFSTRVSDCGIRPDTNYHTQVICKKPFVQQPEENIALIESATAWQSSTNIHDSVHGLADKAKDGITSGVWAEGSLSATEQENDPTWHVTWPAAHHITRIKVWNRTDPKCWDRTDPTNLIRQNCGEKILNFVLTVHMDGHIMWSSADSTVDTSINQVMYDFVDIPSHIFGDKVKVSIPGENRKLSLAEVEVFGSREETYNVARGKEADQSSIWDDDVSSAGSQNAVDGDVTGITDGSPESVTNRQSSPYWHVLLDRPVVIDTVVIYNRVDYQCSDMICSRRLQGFKMEILSVDENGNESPVYTYDDPSPTDPGVVIPLRIPSNIVGNKVKISLPGKKTLLHMREVQVFSRVGCFDVIGYASNRVCQAPNLKVSYYKDNLDDDGMTHQGYNNVLLPVAGLLSLAPYDTKYDFGGAIDFNEGSGLVLTSGRSDDVAARFVGYALFDVTGIYSICTDSDDESKVYIDGVLIVGAKHDEGTQCQNMTNVAAGVKRVVVEYREGGEGASCHIKWTPPNDGNRVVLPFIFAASGES